MKLNSFNSAESAGHTGKITTASLLIFSDLRSGYQKVFSIREMFFMGREQTEMSLYFAG